jgi:hypothetical protein
MIAHRSGAPTITSSYSYAVGCYQHRNASCGGNLITFTDFGTRSICQCGSHMITENTWSDGLATYECASCNASLSYSPQPTA